MEIKYCKNCRAGVKITDSYCFVCGNKVMDEEDLEYQTRQGGQHQLYIPQKKKPVNVESTIKVIPVEEGVIKELSKESEVTEILVGEETIQPSTDNLQEIESKIKEILGKVDGVSIEDGTIVIENEDLVKQVENIISSSDYSDNIDMFLKVDNKFVSAII